MTAKGFEDWMSEAGDRAELEDRAAQKLVAKLRGQVVEARREAKLAHADAVLADARLAHALELKDAPRDGIASFVPIAKARKHRNRGMPVAMCSDLHIEENVDPRTVEGLNEYNPQISQRRMEYMFEGFAWHWELYAKSWDVTDACLWLGGDVITGYIHEELVESNWLSPSEASLRAQQLLADGIEYLIRRCDFVERLYVPCNFGNHGRSTPKRRISTGAKNSWEWLMYQTLKQRFANEPRVQFDVAGGDLLYANLYGRTFRFHHGDNIGYQGGIGGLTIPLRKKCVAWDTSRKAYCTVIGHWHTFCDYNYAVGNGSLIGYGPYSMKIGAYYELPIQGSFLVCEQRGKTAVSPVYCDPDRKSAM